MSAGIKGAVIGGIAGIAGAGAVSALGNVGVGFFAGALQGAVGGAAGGFVGGSLNAWANGYSFGDGLLAGLKGAGIGAIAGGLIGGTISGISSIAHNGDFWTGKGATFEQLASTSGIDSEIEEGDGMEYNNEYAKKYSDANFGKIEKLDNLHADGTAPENYTLKSNGTIYRHSDMRMVNGVTRFNGFGKGYDVFLGKNVFVSRFNLYLTMGHEYTHIAINIGQRVKYYDNNQSHAITSAWEYNQMQAWNMNDAISKPYLFDMNKYSTFFNLNLYNAYSFPLKSSYPILP